MDKLWFKIGETAKRIGVTPKELRYWEEVIPEIRPRRSSGNLRYYHLDELPRLARIKGWLAEGLTVGDCRELIRTGQVSPRLDLGLDLEPAPAAPEAPAPAPPAEPRKAPAMDLAAVAEALRQLLQRLSAPPPRIPAPAAPRGPAPGGAPPPRRAPGVPQPPLPMLDGLFEAL